MRKVAFFMLIWLLSVAAHARQKPNVIVIYADDIGYGDISSYGSKAISTPNIDKMAHNGLRFTSGYATSSTCTPSRYSLLTGINAYRNKNAKILPGTAPLIIDPDSQDTLASALNKAGYATALVGKWHLGLGTPEAPAQWNDQIKPGPKELGFDFSYHMAATGDRTPAVYIENGQVDQLDSNDPIYVGQKAKKAPTGISHPEMLRVQADPQHSGTIVNGISRIGKFSGGEKAHWIDESMPDVFLGKAIEFIKGNKSKPFFLFYAVHENHVPRAPHPRFIGSSGVGVRGDAVVQFDWGVGKILETLKKLKLEKDTLIILSSDNGPVLHDGYDDGSTENNGSHRPSGPFRGGKYGVYEGSTRMPFIVYWKGRVQAGISSAIISQVDLLPTLANITGGILRDKNSLDGIDLTSTLLGDESTGRGFVVQQGVRNFGLRVGDWKYIRPGKVRNPEGIHRKDVDLVAQPGALYFLPEDPEERNNLAQRYPEKVKIMADLLKQQLKNNQAPTESLKKL